MFVLVETSNHMEVLQRQLLHGICWIMTGYDTERLRIADFSAADLDG